MPLAWARGASNSVTLSTRADMSKSSSDTAKPPLSAFEVSSSSSTIESSARADASAVLA